MVELGGHPNVHGVFSSLELDQSTKTASVGFLHPGTLAQVAALKAAIDVAVVVAKTCGLIYPERFRIASVNEEIDQLVKHSGDVFRKHAARAG